MTFSKKHVGTVDIDIVLVDASLDSVQRPERRAIAALSIGVEANDAYFAVAELRDAVDMVGKRHPGGQAKLGRILGTRCDDYQRAIYYALAGRGASHMLDDLDWLAAILEARGRVSREYAVTTPIPPYVAAEPDGPVGCFTPSFPLGSSWRSFRVG
ncbi:hypothetical protein DFR49_0942 [Hephaestia caeni]|uniref:Uncharacterized protein n=1 Tax=Hephaestia caeni TaxID=645617 RepID=A0A397PL41_9SPHN|nr:hypothetical protein [Hephaestia caeni]RIA46401.1 hypothetical protein DFR49_0942 [Hephaestia caeni]